MKITLTGRQLIDMDGAEEVPLSAAEVKKCPTVRGYVARKLNYCD